MTDIQDDNIHQIEYRWHDRRDLSPIASTMSPDSLRDWDSWIKTWVRHPHVEGLGESVCYQVQPDGRAALAWRYEDWQAAERADGTKGRPLVSRVLAGHASQLTPEVAIALCYAGLPDSAGPPPGQVATDLDLTRFPADDLAALTSGHAAGLDRAAATQQDYLLRILAPALADSHTPIAVHLANADILKSPDKGSPCLLLWGLWRIIRPVLGTGGRGWSFSTFELPLGDVDPATMPDVVFRQAEYSTGAVARPRRELKIRPAEPKPPEGAHEFVELAHWLLAEYQESGGDGLRRLIESWQGSDKSVQPRISRIYEELQAKRSPVVLQGSVTPPLHHLPGLEWQRQSEPKSEPARAQPVLVEPIPVEPVPIEPVPIEPVPIEPVPIEPVPVESAKAEAPAPTDLESAAPAAAEFATDDQQSLEEAWTGRIQRRQAPSRRFAVNALLKRLPDAENPKIFQDIVRDILDERNPPEYDDRRLARREISKADWYPKVSAKSHRDALIDLLAAIFEVVIIPDLDLPDVIDKAAEWADGAAPPVIGGLLAAAQQSGDENSRKMMEIVQSRLAHRWMLENDLDELWYTVTTPPVPDEPDRGRWFNFRGRN